jgi:hypothetical protein
MTVRHYISFWMGAKPYAVDQGADPANWQRDLLDDLTDGGRVILYEPLPPGHRGAVLGLCGSRFYGEVCADDRRPDTLFLFHVESARNRRPRVKPSRYEAEFELLRQPAAPATSVPNSLLASDSWIPMPGSASTPTAPVVAPHVVPSQLIVDALVPAAPTLLARMRPGATEDALDLARLRVLHDIVPVPCRMFATRQDGILKGRIEPPSGEGLLRELAGLFDVRLMNRIAARPATRAAVLRLAELLPVHGATRRTTLALWCALLAEQDPDALKLELQAARSAVASAFDTDIDPIVQFVECIEHVARRFKDPSLQEVVDLARADIENAPAVVATWASSLVIRVDDAAASEATPSAAPVLAATASNLADLVPADVPMGASMSAVLPGIGTTAVALAHDDGIADPVLRWCLRLRLPERAQLEAWIAAAEALRQAAWADVALTAQRAEGHLAALERATAELASAERVRSPLAGELAAAGLAVGTVCAAWSVDAAALLAADVDEHALRVLHGSPSLLAVALHLPAWILPHRDDGAREDDGTVSALPPGARACLADSALCEQLVEVAAKLASSGVALDSVGSLAAPPYDVDPVAFLVSSARELIDSQMDLTALGDHPRRVFHALAERGFDPRIAVSTAQRFDVLLSRISGEVAAQVADALCVAPTESELEREFGVVERTIEQFESLLGSANEIGVSQWNTAHQRIHESYGAAVAPPITIRHAFMDATGQRVPAYYFPLEDATRPYGIVRLPVVLQARAPSSAQLQLSLRVMSRHREHWPSEWDAPSPERVSLRPQDWKQVPASDEYEYTLTLVLPIRLLDRVRDRVLSVEIQATETQRDVRLAPVILEWDRLVTVQGPLAFSWGDGVDTRYVAKHPIGPQRRVDSLINAIRAGNSFAIVAPRRFGKSSLCRYLAERLGDDGCCVAEVVCTRMAEVTTGDFEKLWNDVSQQITGKLGVGMSGLPIGGMPPLDAFDRARRAANQQGIKRILLLIDEAQLLFAREGTVLGDALKDALEREWTATAGMASVQIGLIGLPSLEERCGTNLAAMLRMLPAELDEADLNRALLAITDEQLHTTKLARQELARRAGNNLFILKLMVDALCERLNAEQRRWIVDRDVTAVYAELREKVKRGEHTQVAKYVRDALNDSDSINSWLPKACFPLAAALALVTTRQGLTGERALEEAQRVLLAWCDEHAGQRGLVRQVYTLDRAREDLRQLRDLDVYDSTNGFHSELLCAHLEHQAVGFPVTEEDRRALLRCTIPRLLKPKVLTKVAEGGQATIFRFEEGGLSYAWREVALRTTADARRFAETATALEAIRTQIRHADGGQYVYDLDRMGISDENRGVEVYRWIEGSNLEGVVAQGLSATFVLDLAWRLSLGVAMLHRNGILHRDISPRNIVIGEGAIPVLVDFGLARASGAEMRTQLMDPYTAPEVAASPPLWTAAADVYSLGATLAWAAERVPATAQGPLAAAWAEFVAFIAEMVGLEPGSRPEASRCAEQFERIRSASHLDDRMRDAWARIGDRAGRLENARVFRKLLDENRSDLLAAAVGLYFDSLERCMVAALFLNKVVEAYTYGSSLGQLYNLGYRVGVQEIDAYLVKAGAELRNARSHHRAADNWQATLLGRIGARDAADAARMVRELASQVGAGVRLGTLEDVVGIVLDGTGGA